MLQASLVLQQQLSQFYTRFTYAAYQSHVLTDGLLCKICKLNCQPTNCSVTRFVAANDWAWQSNGKVRGWAGHKLRCCLVRAIAWGWKSNKHQSCSGDLAPYVHPTVVVLILCSCGDLIWHCVWFFNWLYDFCCWTCCGIYTWLTNECRACGP